MSQYPFCGNSARFSFSSGLSVIDWKTSIHKKASLRDTYDQPLQVAAYVGLWNSNFPGKQVT